ncbi:MAG: hypothetical protein N3H30_01740 [Candidatus Micrarchaeota archaeon]|nr:hypothetical protein [Candidatus Micrarchaeota archaeon]
MEYLSYFMVFLFIAAAFSSFVFSSSNQELSRRSQERFKSIVLYISQGVVDADELAKSADFSIVNITIPTVVRGTPITIGGDGKKGIIVANTTDQTYGNVVYYVRTGEFTSEVCMLTQDSVTVATEGEGVCP